MTPNSDSQQPGADFSECEKEMQALFQATVPEVPPVDVDSLVETQTARVPSPIGGTAAGGLFLSHVIPVASVVGIGVLLIMAWNPAHDQALAFHDVQQTVKEQQTAQYLLTTIRTRPSERGLPSDFAPAVRSSRVFIKGKHLQRWESAENPGQYDVIDSFKGLSVTVNSADRIFVIHKRKVVIDIESGEQHESDYEPKSSGSGFFDFYHSFRTVPDDIVQDLGPAMVDGQAAHGFRRVVKHGLTTITYSYWVDPDTRLPIRIETKHRSLDPQVAEYTYVMNQFVFDARMDDSLFSTEPPDGFRVVEDVIRQWK